MTQVRSDRYVEETREQALEDFFLFTRAILGFDRLTERFHKDMCNELQHVDALRRLWLVPRDHFKSTIVSTAYPIWLLARNSEERILLAGDTSAKAEGKLKKIKELIIRSAGIRAFFPELIPPNIRKTTWSDSEIVIPRGGAHAEPSIMAVGAGVAVVGYHFTRIIPDDIIGREAANSPTVMRGVISWVDDLESLLEEPYVNTIDMVGTHWTHDDVYHHVKKHWDTSEVVGERPFFKGFYRSFWVSEGEPLFPELYGGKANALDYAARGMKQNPYLWSCNYLNDPRVPEAEFDLEDLQYYRWDDQREHVIYELQGRERVAGLAAMAVFMTVDPAYSKERGASDAAIYVSGCVPTGEVFTLEAVKGKWGSQGLIKQVGILARKYLAYLRAIGVEATGTQQSWVDDLSKELRKMDIHTNVESLRPGSVKDKDGRIRFHFQRVVANRRLYITSEQSGLIDEIRHFPMTRHKDLLDAGAYAAEFYWTRNFSESPEEEAEEERELAAREATRDPHTGY